jgi:voltage-gated potassium channel
VAFRFRTGLALIAGVMLAGTVGYVVIEGASWWDAFYMTVITITTVGYREVFPLSRAGEIFTVVLLLVGIGTLLSLLTEASRHVIEGELGVALGRARRTRMIEKMSGHEIVCGFGRMGQAVVEALKDGKRPFLVIEKDHEKVRQLLALGVAVVEGDATNEAVLKSAHVERARGLVACLADDAHNVYVTLTARALVPDLFIVARVAESGAEERLKRAGANRVVNPYVLGGTRLAHLLLKPAVVDFLDITAATGVEQLELEEVVIGAQGPLTGKTIADSDLRRRFGLAVVAVKRGPRLLPNPGPELAFAADDVLVVLGQRAQVTAFERHLGM